LEREVGLGQDRRDAESGEAAMVGPGERLHD
jgi:hypothetical protein